MAEKVPPQRVLLANSLNSRDAGMTKGALLTNAYQENYKTAEFQDQKRIVKRPGYDLIYSAFGSSQGITFYNGQVTVINNDTLNVGFPALSAAQGSFTLTGKDVTFSVVPSPYTFLAVANGTDKGAMSSDGLNWTEITLPASRNWSSVCWNGSKFCAVAGENNNFTSGIATNKGAISSDGVHWTEVTLPSSQSWSAVAWNGSVFCAVSAGSTAAATSSDGVTWNASTLPSSRIWTAIAWNGSTFCAISKDNVNVTSPDGVTWASNTCPPNNRGGLTRVGNGFCIVQTGIVSAISSQGTSWTTGTIPGFGDGWQGVTTNNTTIVGVATFANSYRSITSTDGLNWTGHTGPVGDWRSITYGAGLYCVVAGGTPDVNLRISNISAVSSDGLNWTLGTLPAYRTWSSVCSSQ